MKANSIRIEGKTIAEIAKDAGLTYSAVLARHKAGATTIEELSKPSTRGKHKAVADEAVNAECAETDEEIVSAYKEIKERMASDTTGKNSPYAKRRFRENLEQAKDVATKSEPDVEPLAEAVKQPTEQPAQTAFTGRGYYASHGIEAMDIIENYALNFALGNVIKYVLRCGKKGTSSDAIADLRKAESYIEREIQRRETDKASSLNKDLEAFARRENG